MVKYNIGGTATNGDRLHLVASSVSIPQGSTSAAVTSPRLTTRCRKHRDRRLTLLPENNFAYNVVPQPTPPRSRSPTRSGRDADGDYRRHDAERRGGRLD